jgi:hypothetical protein
MLADPPTEEDQAGQKVSLTIEASDGKAPASVEDKR